MACGASGLNGRSVPLLAESASKLGAGNVIALQQLTAVLTASLKTLKNQSPAITSSVAKVGEYALSYCFQSIIP